MGREKFERCRSLTCPGVFMAMPLVLLGSGWRRPGPQQMGPEKEAKARPQRACEPQGNRHSATQDCDPVFHYCFQTKEQLVESAVFRLREKGARTSLAGGSSRSSFAHRAVWPRCYSVRLPPQRKGLSSLFPAGFQVGVTALTWYFISIKWPSNLKGDLCNQFYFRFRKLAYSQ